MFEEKAANKGHSSQVTEAHKFVEELGTSLTLEHSDLSCNSHKGSEGLIEKTKVEEHLKKAAMDKLKKKKQQARKVACGSASFSLARRGAASGRMLC